MGHSLAYTYYITFQHRYIGSIQCDQMLKNNSPIFPTVAKKVVLIKEWCFMK